MCGYCCELCKAYIENVRKQDQRAELSRIWKKYYDIDALPENIRCDGCRSTGGDAVRIDSECPVRACVLAKGIGHCGLCDQYPCAIFMQREGLSCRDARKKLGADFDQAEYDEYLQAYDNSTRLDEYRKKNR